ncbi:CsxC family protein [Clostridium sp. WILCCON 0269]|uniref:CsxC family protein n=1 Tax=Candidatus Clostridium eludens TaxID=3381663 RepID=A0ABW8SIA0_9CLOT
MDNNNFYSDSSARCSARVINADTLPLAHNYPWPQGEFKIPKVLAELVIQIDSESKIRLNEPSYEIKRIEKQIFLTQCRYIAPTNKVFIEGYIRKNIEYAVRECVTEDTTECKKGSGIGGIIKDTTVHVPFKVATEVDFEHFPKVHPNLPPRVARYFDAKRSGKNIREADRSNVEIFNEPIFCELEWSAVFDADIDDRGIPIDGFINEEEFEEFTDKSVVYLCLKLLQKQQVSYLDTCNDYTGNAPKQGVKKQVRKSHPTLDSDWNFPINELKQRK